MISSPFWAQRLRIVELWTHALRITRIPFHRERIAVGDPPPGGAAPRMRWGSGVAAGAGAAVAGLVISLTGGVEFG
jgi:hypothetical protein